MRGTMKLKKLIQAAWFGVLLLLLNGCTTIVNSISQGFAEDLSAAILNNNDLDMVRDGAPSYLILIDSLLASSPDDAFMLRQSAKLHSAYAAAFVTEEVRAKLLHDKARRLALASVCSGMRNACEIDQLSFQDFNAWLAVRKKRDVPQMYDLGTTWAGWIQANSDDFSAIADLGKVKALMTRTAELDPNYDSGGVFLYLGVFETLLPPAMGGKPELGRRHFERAIELSEGDNLLAKVMFAEQYGRLVFDRKLHDRLLTEVLESPGDVPGLTLMNTVAKQQAQQLLDSADDYF